MLVVLETYLENVAFDLFTACKQAYLVVLTVNVIVIFCFYDVLKPFFCLFLAACVLWVKAAQTSGWPSLIQSWCKHLLTVFFFYQMSIVSDECIYFWSCPHLCKEFAQCVRLRWRQDPLFFCFVFCFKDFKLRIKNETQYIAINHNLWSWLFLWENWFFFSFFPNSKKMVYGI